MEDIFISYARPDEDKVRALAAIFEEEGLSVWWDQYLFAGEDYREKIETALKTSKVVLVCWSKHSAASDWVRAEAEDARVNGKLVSASFDGCDVPKPFNTYHIEKLGHWQGAMRTPGTERLVEALQARIEGRAPDPLPISKKMMTRGALAAGAVTLIAVVGWFSGILQPLLIREDIADMRAEMDDVRREMTAMQFELMTTLAARAAAQDIYIPDDARSSISATIAKVLDPAEERRSDARAALQAGDFEGAAAALVKLAEEQSLVVEKTRLSAAKTYGEAGDLFFATDTDKAIEAYAKATELDPTDTISRNQLGHLYRRIGELDKAAAQYQQIIDANAGGSDDNSKYWEGAALANLGNIAETRGDFDEAEALYTRALNIQQALGNEEEIAIAIGNLGIVASERGNIAEAEEKFLAALEIYEKLGLKARIARQYRNLGATSNAKGDNERSDEYYLKAIAIYEEIGDEGELASQLTGLGANANDRGEYDKGVEYLERALEIHRRFGNIEAVGVDLNNLGVAAMALNDYSAAERYYKESVEIQEKLGNMASAAMTLSNLADAARRQGNLDDTEVHLKRALTISEEINSTPSIGIVNNSLGSLALERGQYESAKAYYAKSKTIFEDMGFARGVAVTTGNLALITDLLGDLDTAETQHKAALAMFRDIGDRNNEANTMGNLADVVLARGRIDEAATLRQASLEIYEELGAKAGMASQLNGLGAVQRARSDFTGASDFHERALALAIETEDKMQVAFAELGLAHIDAHNKETASVCARLERSRDEFSDVQTRESKQWRTLNEEMACAL